MLNYWYRLNNLGKSFPLLNDAYCESKLLYEQNIPSWYTTINFLINKLDGSQNLRGVKESKFKSALKNCLFKNYINEWRLQASLHSDKKLSCYVSLKQSFGLEKYLNLLKNFEQRRNFTRFRISAHRLNIERGRYQGIPRESRHCMRCNSGVLDDEKHFLLTCSYNKEDRDVLQELVNEVCKNFCTMNNDQKLFWLMTNEDHRVLQQISKMISQASI